MSESGFTPAVASAPTREGSLDAPTRHPLDWKNPQFYEQGAIDERLKLAVLAHRHQRGDVDRAEPAPHTGVDCREDGVDGFARAGSKTRRQPPRLLVAAFLGERRVPANVGNEERPNTRSALFPGQASSLRQRA